MTPYEEREQKERERHEDLTRKAGIVLCSLGYDVHPNDDHYRNSVTGTKRTGQEIWISWDYSPRGKKDMFRFSGRAPADVGGGGMSFRDYGVVGWNEHGPECKIDAAKNYDVIAKEADRRFLKEYERLYGEALERRKLRVLHAQKAERAAEYLSKIPGVEAEYSVSGQRGRIYLRGLNGHGDFSGSDSMNLELRSLDVEEAFYILTYLVNKKMAAAEGEAAAAKE